MCVSIWVLIEWASARVPPTPLLGGWAEGGWCGACLIDDDEDDGDDHDEHDDEDDDDEEEEMMMRMRSSQSFGRIAVTHNTPSGKRCQKKHWHVPKKKGRKKRKERERCCIYEGILYRPLKVGWSHITGRSWRVWVLSVWGRANGSLERR